jgi:mercuric ion transport protein
MSQPISVAAETSSRSAILSYLSLFASFGTLVCCALPSLLVLLGLGATVASVLSTIPWLVAVSRHKEWVFAISGALIAANLGYVYLIAPKLLAQGAACPPARPEACVVASRASRVVLWVSGIIYLFGIFSAYILGPLLMRFG